MPTNNDSWGGSRSTPGTLHDTTEGRIVHSWEWRKMRLKDRRTLIGAGVFGAVAVITAFVLLLGWANQQQSFLSAGVHVPPTVLYYEDAKGSFLIDVQRINPTHADREFTITVYTFSPDKHSSLPHAIERSVTFTMYADPPADGHTYILHCTYNKKFYPFAAVLELTGDMQGTAFTGGGTLYLDIGRLGKFPMGPVTTSQVSDELNALSEG